MLAEEKKALKATLIRRLNKFFQNQMINYSFDFEEGVSAFLNFIELPINTEESALDLTVLPNLYQYYVGATSYEEQLTIVKEIATSLDPILKKILHYINNPKYNQLASQKKGLKEYILALPLMIKDYPDDKPPESVLYNIVNIQSTDRGMPFDLQKAYFTRNHVHAAKEWDETELSANIKSCVVTYLYAFFEYYPQLKIIISPPAPQYDFSPYLQSKFSEFQKILLPDYTDLSAKETDLYDENLSPMAKEYYEADFEEDENEDFDEDDFELLEDTNRITKPTKVNEIRTQVPQMLVRGDAGMGKTTTLEHLFLADLQNALQNPTIIPFFFELKDYNGKNLFTQIAKQNKVDEIALRKATEEGKVCLFLDGFDEILNDEKRNHLEIIIKDEILTTTSQVLISSRIREYEHDIFKMRVFDLQALSKEQIREYASKNIPEDKKAIFLQALFEKENSILLSICRNIFILKVYKNEIIEAENGEIISKSIGKLLQNLVNRRVDRQTKENKPNANAIKKDLGKYKKMINFLAYTLIDKELSFEYDLAIELLKSEVSDLSLADDCLNFYKSIGLIKGETGILKFTHKLYWEYFAAEFIWTKVQVQFDNIQHYINVPKWKKVLNLVRGLAGEQSTKIVETVAVTDALTMAESIGSSIEQKHEEVVFVIAEAEKQARTFHNVEMSAQGFLALVELGETDIIFKIFKSVTIKKTHKAVIEKIIAQADTDKALDIIEISISLSVKQNRLKRAAIENFDKEITNGIAKQRLHNLIEKLIQEGSLLSWEFSGALIVKYQLQDKFSIKVKDLIGRIIQQGSLPFLQLAENWIEKYTLIDKFSIKILAKNIIFKLIDHERRDCSLLAVNLIEKYQLKDIFSINNLILNIIKKSFKNQDKSSLQLAATLIEKYQLQDKFPTESLIEKLVRNGSTQSLRLAAALIEKYQLQNKFPIEILVERLIRNNDYTSLNLVENWIEKHQLQNKFPIEILIEKLIENGDYTSLNFAEILMEKHQIKNKIIVKVFIEKLIQKGNKLPLQLAATWIEKHQLQDKFPVETLIENSIQKGSIKSLQLAKNWIAEGNLQDKFPIKILIEKLIQNKDYVSLKLAKNWVAENQLQNEFPIEDLIEKLIRNEDYVSLKLAKNWIVEGKLQDKFPAEILIKKLIQNKSVQSFQLAKSWITEGKLQDKFPTEILIEELIQNQSYSFLQLAENWIVKYQLQDKFSVEILAEKLIQNQDKKSLNLARKWIKKYRLQDKILIKKPTEKNIVVCHVTNIIPSRVFVKIEGEERKASIYIGELTNARLIDICDFEYNGEKLHIGQKLIVKVINIDEQDRINLSLKRMK